MAESNEVPSEYVQNWKRIVTELSLKAPEPHIKMCLQSYNPEQPTKYIANTLSKNFKKDTIFDTLNFLSKGNAEKANKNDLVQKLCLKVKSYFPDICQICNATYVFNFDDKPLLECESCGQEVHRECYVNLFKEMNLLDENEVIRDTLFKIPGISFLCQSCHSETVSFTHRNISHPPSKTPSPTESQEKVTHIEILEDTFSTKKVNLPTSNPTPRRTLPMTPNVIISNNPNHNPSTYAGRTEFMRNKFQKDNQNKLPLSSDSKKSGENYNRQICRFYMKGKCKHGLKGRDCQYIHPKACT